MNSPEVWVLTFLNLGSFSANEESADVLELEGRDFLFPSKEFFFDFLPPLTFVMLLAAAEAVAEEAEAEFGPWRQLMDFFNDEGVVERL